MDKNADKCLCPGCPSHNEFMKSDEERIFCSRGKTECNLEKRGCLCGTCPVKQDLGLNDFYYCADGSSK